MKPTARSLFPRLSCTSLSLQNRNSVLTVSPASVHSRSDRAFPWNRRSPSIRSVMARSAVAMAVAMVVLVAMVALVPSASAAPCGNIQSMLPCVAAARDGTPPSQGCCTAVNTYAQGGTPEGEACLCQAVTNAAAKAAGMKMNYAMLIPQKCNLDYKAGYVCNGVLIPGGHP